MVNNRLSAISFAAIACLALFVLGEARSLTQEKGPCVHDTCPFVLVQGAGSQAVNGVYQRSQTCSHPAYGYTGSGSASWIGWEHLDYTGNTDSIWREPRMIWYRSGTSTLNGWGITMKDRSGRYHHRYYANGNPFVLNTQANQWNVRTSHADTPSPMSITCHMTNPRPNRNN